MDLGVGTQQWMPPIPRNICPKKSNFLEQPMLLAELDVRT